MANKKNKPYATFETKELFDKHIEQVYESGREKGFKEGRIWVLSYFNDLIDCMFSPQEIMEAESEMSNRHIEEWRKAKEVRSLKQKLEWKHLVKEVEKEAEES